MSDIDRILTGATPERYVYEAARAELAALRDEIAELNQRIKELEEQQRPRYSTEQIVEQKLLQRDFERAEGRA